MLTIDFTVSDTWGPVVKNGVEKKELTIIPYELQLNYDYWTFRKTQISLLSVSLCALTNP